MKRGDLISSLFWFLVGAGFASGGLYYGFGSWRQPGPGLLPTLFGIVLAALSCGLLVMRLKTRGDPATVPFWKASGSWRRIAFTLFALIAYLMILKEAGFILTTFLFVLFLLRFVGGKRWMMSVLTALVFAMVSYAVFSALLGTPFPKGRIYGTTFGPVSWV